MVVNFDFVEGEDGRPKAVQARVAPFRPANRPEKGLVIALKQ